MIGDRAFTQLARTTQYKAKQTDKHYGNAEFQNQY